MRDPSLYKVAFTGLLESKGEKLFLKVEKVWRGLSGETRIKLKNSLARMTTCDATLSVGTTYLVLIPSSLQEPLWIGGCSRLYAVPANHSQSQELIKLIEGARVASTFLCLDERASLIKELLPVNAVSNAALSCDKDEHCSAIPDICTPCWIAVNNTNKKGSAQNFLYWIKKKECKTPAPPQKFQARCINKLCEIQALGI